MKTISSNLQTHIAQDVTTLATCWLIQRRIDSVKQGFTDHTEDIVIDDTEIDPLPFTFISAVGYSTSAIKSTANMSVDNLDATAVLKDVLISTDGGILEQDLRAGLYDDADLKMFQVNWRAPEDGLIKMRRGFLGEVTIVDGRFQAEVRGLTQALQQPFGIIHAAMCTVTLGGTECKVRLQPPVWPASTPVTQRLARQAETGSVVRPTTQNRRHFKCTTAGTTGGTEPAWDTVIGNTTADGGAVWTTIQALTLTGTVDNTSSRKLFTDASFVEANEFWENGKLTWTSGNNINFSREIKVSDSFGNFEMYESMDFDIQIGDTFTVEAGCQKFLAVDCNTKFDNTHNFQGFPFIPGLDLLNQYPNARS